MHENCSVEPFQAQEVTIETLSQGPKKPKFSKCFVLNQISGECCIWLVKVLHGRISSRILSQSDLFMTQVDYMLFLKFWVRSIQTLPNSVRWLPNFGILFLTPPNMSGKAIKSIHNSTNNFYSLILHLPVDSSPWVTRKNIEFHE